MLSKEKGTIHHMSEVSTGVSQSGREWARMTLVISCPMGSGTFKFIAFKVGTDRIDDVLEFHEGDKVEVSFAISAREWQGKWFNDLDLVTINAQEAAPAPAPAPQRPSPQRPAAPAPQQAAARTYQRRQPAPAPQDYDLEPKKDDLPF